jgi:hypothetical protein
MPSGTTLMDPLGLEATAGAFTGAEVHWCHCSKTMFVRRVAEVAMKASEVIKIHAGYMQNSCGIHAGYMRDTYLGGLGVSKRGRK